MLHNALRITSLFALIIPSLTVRSQPVVTRSDFESNLGVITSTTYSISLVGSPGPRAIVQGIIDNTVGPNQTYDFSGLTFLISGSTSGEYTNNVAGLPGANRPEFSSANFAFASDFTDGSTTGDFYQFIELQDGAYLSLGSWFVTPDSSYGQYSTPPDMTYKLPLTNGTAWTSAKVLTFVSPSGSFMLPADTTDYLVEGYGTLMLPGGRSAQALRIRAQRGSGFFATTIYEFFSTGSFQANIIVSVDFAPPFMPAPSSASYSVVDMSGVGVDPDDVPRSFSLGQNYPNPFNPATVIPFELASADYATLRIYDTLGREVETLVDAMIAPGTHRVTWQASGVPSGVYFYTLDVAGTRKTRSLMVFR